jgi:hypothetical protein
MSNETWMNAKKAVELGFADEVLFDGKEPEPEGEPEENAEPVAVKAQMYSGRLMDQAILNRLYPWHDAEDDIDYSGFPRKYETLAEEIAVYLINKRGAEGETAHNENGINRTYESASVPDSMLRTVIPMVKIPGGNLYESTGTE